MQHLLTTHFVPRVGSLGKSSTYKLPLGVIYTIEAPEGDSSILLTTVLGIMKQRQLAKIKNGIVL